MTQFVQSVDTSMSRRQSLTVAVNLLLSICLRQQVGVSACNLHGRRFVGGQEDMSPYFLKWIRRPVYCPPTFSGGRHFCTNAHGIRWMIGTIVVEFSHLIFMEIIKIVPTRCHILRLCTKFNFGWGSAPDPAGGDYSAPSDSLTGFKGAYF